MPQKSRLDLPPLDLGEETIGQRISRIRKSKGLTQTELAERIGIIQGLVSSYERERLRLHAEMLARFALALEVSADELLGLEKPKENEKSPQPRFLKRLREVEKLSKRDQEALLRTIEAFVKKT